ncbi:unnamed protein product [Rhizophagus irregularis]|nr:unnamed protein product [Rhizophagus irregularis]
MEFNSLFRRYFKELKDDSLDKEDDEFAENIHVINTSTPSLSPLQVLFQQGVPQDAADWSNSDSVYNWIITLITLKRSSEIATPKVYFCFNPLSPPLFPIANLCILSVSGAKFPLQGRDETMRILLNGNGAREGMCQRFENRKKKD